MKLIVIISTTGRSPSIAAPAANPTNPFSAIGVSTTRLGPNSLSKPAVILYDPSKVPISSPMRKTFLSRSNSSRKVSWSACLKVTSAIVIFSRAQSRPAHKCNRRGFPAVGKDSLQQTGQIHQHPAPPALLSPGGLAC